MEWVNPASCPPHKHYAGIVRTPGGTHRRILRRLGGDAPWFYFRPPSESPHLPPAMASNALDDEVSELIELHPNDVFDFQRKEDELRAVKDELNLARGINEILQKQLLSQTAPRKELTEERVREIVKEEIRQAEWTLK